MSVTIVLSFVVIYTILLDKTAASFTIVPSVSRSSSIVTKSRLGVGGSPFSFGKKEEDPLSMPRDVKEAVSKCRLAVQKALEQKQSRMKVDMPVGTKFGVEAKSTSSKKSALLLEDDDVNDNNNNSNVRSKVTLETLQRSDRELARLFVEMFQPVGGSAISVVFAEESLAEQAGRVWKGDSTANCRISSMQKSKREKKKKKKQRGFAAKMADSLNDNYSSSGGGAFELPEGCEVALFVAPTDLATVENVCLSVGMGTLVVLLNARLADEDTTTTTPTSFDDANFEPVFCLTAAPQDAAPNCLLHRAFPNDWLLARKPKVGQPKVIAQQATRPTLEQCREAYDNVQMGEVEGAVENVLGNVANWFS